MWASPRHTTLLHLGSTKHYVCFLRHGLWYERDEERGPNSIEMNLESIEEHQAENLVFAQYNYLYIPLEATSAYVIVPIAKVPRTQYSD